MFLLSMTSGDSSILLLRSFISLFAGREILLLSADKRRQLDSSASQLHLAVRWSRSAPVIDDKRRQLDSSASQLHLAVRWSRNVPVINDKRRQLDSSASQLHLAVRWSRNRTRKKPPYANKFAWGLFLVLLRLSYRSKCW